MMHHPRRGVDAMDAPTAEQTPMLPTYVITYTECLPDDIKAEHFHCRPIEEVERELRVHDLIHVRLTGAEWECFERTIGQKCHFIGRVYKRKRKDLAVHIERTGWRIPLNEVEALGLVVTFEQEFRH
jgi:hypothetical protein